MPTTPAPIPVSYVNPLGNDGSQNQHNGTRISTRRLTPVDAILPAEVKQGIHGGPPAEARRGVQ